MPRIFEPRPLLLDTHIWVWLVEGSETLTAGARRSISRAASAGELRIAAITMWEVAMLSARNRIVLDEPIGRWLDQALTRSAVVVEPLSPEVAVESCELPGVFHRDPVDRMLVATARVTKATLMARDHRILDYAAEGHLSATQA